MWWKYWWLDSLIFFKFTIVIRLNFLYFLYAVSCYSLFPLLFEAGEYPIKVTLLLLHCILMWFGFSALFPEATITNSKKHPPKKNNERNSDRNLINTFEKGKLDIGWIRKSYLVGLVAVEIWGQFLHPLILENKLPFLPLMLVSIYSAFGMIYSWIWQLKWIVLSSSWFS